MIVERGKVVSVLMDASVYNLDEDTWICTKIDHLVDNGFSVRLAWDDIWFDADGYEKEWVFGLHDSLK